MRKIFLITVAIFLTVDSFAQLMDKEGRAILSQEVITEFANMIDYQSNYAVNSDMFKSTIVKNIMRQAGNHELADAIIILQGAASSKSNRDLIINAITEYTSINRLKEALLSWGISSKSANAIEFYARNGMGLSKSQLSKVATQERENDKKRKMEDKARLISEYKRVIEDLISGKQPLSFSTIFDSGNLEYGLPTTISNNYEEVKNDYADCTPLLTEMAKLDYEGKFNFEYDISGDLERVTSEDGVQLPVDLHKLNASLKLKSPVTIRYNGKLYPVKYETRSFQIGKKVNNLYIRRGYFFTIGKENLTTIQDKYLYKDLRAASRIDSAFYEYPLQNIQKDIFAYFKVNNFQEFKQRVPVSDNSVGNKSLLGIILAPTAKNSSIYCIVYQHAVETFSLSYQHKNLGTLKTNQNKGYYINILKPENFAGDTVFREVLLK